VRNTGKALLRIERVRVECGCTIARYDPAIPSGGEGKVIMKLNLRNFQGKVLKKATVQSNDPHNPELIIKMAGTVQAIIDVKPSTNILFRGMPDQLSESVLDLEGSTPFHISGTESNLSEDIAYTLETVAEGEHYRLRVSNKISNGNYGGFIKLDTDLAQKPDIIIRVSGFIEGEISAKPQNILIGKLCTGQPERVGRVVVVSNRNKPFEITQLTYDQNLMSVWQETLEDQTGFILEVQPKLENVPTGSRKQAVLKIETDLSADAKVEVLVNVLNHSGQPEAQNK